MQRRGFRKSRRAVWLACLVFLGPAVLAESTGDVSASQLTIEGDSAVFLQERNTIEYVGNVVAFMDSMRIVGDSVLVEMNADRIERITTNGAPATFWQQRDTTERDTTAAANTIVYLPDSGLLELSGGASLKQDGNEVSSALIRYDLTLGQLDAGSPNATEERVRMKLKVPTTSSERSSKEP